MFGNKKGKQKKTSSNISRKSSTNSSSSSKSSKSSNNKGKQKKTSSKNRKRGNSEPERLDKNPTNRPLTDEDKNKRKNAGELLKPENKYKGEGSTRRAKNKLPNKVEKGPKILYKDSGHGFYNEQGHMTKRVDTSGAAHGGVSTPHVQEYKTHRGRMQRTSKTVRKPTSAEDPLSHTRSSTSSSSSSNKNKSDDVVARGKQKEKEKQKEKGMWPWQRERKEKQK